MNMSRNKHPMTCDIIQANPDKNWDFGRLSANIFEFNPIIKRRRVAKLKSFVKKKHHQ